MYFFHLWCDIIKSLTLKCVDYLWSKPPSSEGFLIWKHPWLQSSLCLVSGLSIFLAKGRWQQQSLEKGLVVKAMEQLLPVQFPFPLTFSIVHSRSFVRPGVFQSMEVTFNTTEIFSLSSAEWKSHRIWNKIWILPNMFLFLSLSTTPSCSLSNSLALLCCVTIVVSGLGFENKALPHCLFQLQPESQHEWC